MRITLQTVSDLARHFGTGGMELDMNGSTVGDLVCHLRRRYHYDLEAQEYTMLFLNGRGCVSPDTPLREGDRVAIVPIMAAG